MKNIILNLFFVIGLILIISAVGKSETDLTMSFSQFFFQLLIGATLSLIGLCASKS